MKLPAVRPSLPSAPGGVTPALGKLGQWAAGYVFGTARGQYEEIKPGDPFIICEGLVKIYKVADLEVFALQGLDLTVSRGERMAIIGNSGSGKSTLLNTRPSGGDSPSVPGRPPPVMKFGHADPWAGQG